MTSIGADNSIMRLVSELPEPAPPIVRYDVSTNTPWGAAQTASYYGKGIVQYETAGHGGFHVSAGLLKHIPDYLQLADPYARGTGGWFEEDCAWAIVALCFPERFELKDRLLALDMMHSYFPEQYERFLTERRG